MSSPSEWDPTDDILAVISILKGWADLMKQSTEPPEEVIEDAAGEVVDVLRSRWFSDGPWSEETQEAAPEHA